MVPIAWAPPSELPELLQPTGVFGRKMQDESAAAANHAADAPEAADAKSVPGIYRLVCRTCDYAVEDIMSMPRLWWAIIRRRLPTPFGGLHCATRRNLC